MDSMDGLVGAIASFKGQALTLSLGNAATRRPCAGCFDAWHSYRLCQCFDAWPGYPCFKPVPRRLGEEAQEKNRSHRCH